MEPLIERPLSDAELAVLNAHAARTREILKLADSASPETTVKVVEEYVVRWRRGEFRPRKRLFSRSATLEAPDPIKVAQGLGKVWGDALCNQFGWEWTAVRNDDVFLHGVASPDRAWVVYAHGFIGACLLHPQLDCTAMLAFNMIAAGNLLAMPANSSEDLMSGVRRVIPR